MLPVCAQVWDHLLGGEPLRARTPKESCLFSSTAKSSSDKGRSSRAPFSSIRGLTCFIKSKNRVGVHSCNPSLGRLQQEDRELEASLNYTNIACLRYVCMWVCILNFLPRKGMADHVCNLEARRQRQENYCKFKIDPNT